MSIEVPPLSYKDIESKSLIFQQKYFPKHYNKASTCNLLKVFESGYIEKITGFSESIQNLPDLIEGKIDCLEKLFILSTKTHNNLEKQNPRARSTVTHELGHLVLEHHKYIETCLIEQKIVKHLNRGNIASYKDSEWQADSFAYSFLMPFHHVVSIIKKGGTSKDIASIFGTSISSSNIRYKFVKNKMYEWGWFI